MKLFEIGDGLKSIKAPDKYYSDLENADTVILYTNEENDITIRISVISVTPKMKSANESIFNCVVITGNEKGYSVKIENDKSYYQYSNDSKEDETVTFFYEIGYKCNYILISVTTSLEKKSSVELGNILKEVEEMIPTITEISLENQTIFQPRYTDLKSINERISVILNINEEEIDDSHDSDKTLYLIQEILDSKKYRPNQTYELQSLGLALGDYIQYKNGDLHWAVATDSYGRDMCLQYKSIQLAVFPMTMISKRVEDGEKFSVFGLVEGLYNKINEITKDNGYKELSYN